MPQRTKFFTPIQTNMTAGKFSPRLYGRVDLAKYFNAIRDIQNFNILAHGGISKRSGTRYINEVKDSTKNTRLIPFIFSTTQPYILEFGDLYIRFYKEEGQILSGTVAYEIVSPYTAAQVDKIRFTQSADVLYLVHPDVRPKELTRTGDTSWTLTDFDFQDGPYGALNKTSTTLTPSGTTGSVNITASSALFASTDVNGWIRMRHGATWGAAQITSYTSSTVVVATVHADFPFASATASGTFRLPGWSDTVGWPSAQPTFFEERLVFANTSAEPNTFWMSESEDFTKFSPTDADSSVGATNGIRRVLSDNQVNAIFWLSSEDILVAGTSGGPWSIQAANTSSAFGPSNITAKKQNRRGVADVDVVQTDELLYVSRSTLKLRELSFSFEKDKRVSTDLTLLSESITENSGIKNISYVEEPDDKVSCILSNGSHILVTYLKEQEVVAWHKHVLGGTNILIKSQATIPSVDAKSDTTYLIASRTINGVTKQYVEFFEEAYVPTDITQHDNAFFVDSGLTYSGVATGVISGLNHLEGETVTILTNGSTHPSKVVSGGSITLDRSDVTKAHVGLGYTAFVETLPLEIAQKNGSSQGRTKDINKVILRVFESIGGLVRSPQDNDFNEIIPARRVGDPTGIEPPLRSEDISVDFEGDSDTEARIRIEQSLPLPFTLLAIMPHVEIQEI